MSTPRPLFSINWSHNTVYGVTQLGTYIEEPLLSADTYTMIFETPSGLWEGYMEEGPPLASEEDESMHYGGEQW